MKIRQNISQRTKIVGGMAVDNPDITINRVGGGNIVVPITPRSIRRFMLMQDDYVQLEFSTPQPIHISIGDYIQDAIFGKFVVTAEQMPRYNQQTGGYDYSLRFDADYMVWRNWLHCLAVGGKRMESRWDLTDRLDAQVQQVADNVNIILNPRVTEQYNQQTGITTYTSDGYGIEVTAENTAEIKHLAFEGVNIIEAMTRIAEAWSCEWWVTNDSVTNDNTTYSHTIHFGKCEESGNNPYVMALGDNVESMDIARDQQDYCNRLYPYGGTKNIPEDYDRKLAFTATDYNYSAGTVKDSGRELTLDMIQGEGSITPTDLLPFGNAAASGINPRYHKQTSQQRQLSGEQTFDINLFTTLNIVSDDWWATDTPIVEASAKLIYGSNEVELPATQSPPGIGRWYSDIVYRREIDLGSTAVNVEIEVTWKISFALGSVHTTDVVSMETGGTANATANASTATKDLTLMFGGSTYNVRFSGATGLLTFLGSKPSRASFLNKQYTLSPLNHLAIPYSWYTPDYDAGVLATVGEKRLHLPLASYPNRYMEQEAHSANQIVERAVVFDDIYPQLELRVKTVSTMPRKQTVEHSDGSVSYEDWTQYALTLQYYEDGQTDWVDFKFRTSYMLDGEKLQIVFSTGLLSGMTFDAGFDEREYTIIRNDDYGVLLPNERLHPQVGDTLVLTGWNPRAMNDLGMVADAEAALAAKATEYLQAITEGQFTVTNKMMSTTMQSYPFCTGTGRDANGRRMYGLLEVGCKVRINHDALPDGYKVSRVLGYEYKLDIPYDTPTYIVGETEAYSRLKQLEKKITKL